jgi:thiol:disulfide interchange protein DsbD
MRKRYATLALLVGLAVLLIPAVAMADDGGAFAEYQDKGWLWMYLGAFGFGFLTSLTPCVYPMIPIVVGVFGARDENVSRGKAMMLGTMYVLGMCLLYAGLGLIFALIGSKTGLGGLLGNPWVVIPMVLFYVALAASMFGAFELQLPMSWQQKLNRVGGKGYGGAFGMGLVGGLTAAPCTGPFLAGILGFVTATADKGDTATAAISGFTLLFVYALGIGILFWVLAVFAVGVPKSGRWMEWVKSIGGVALLAAAFYFLRPLIPAIEESTQRIQFGSVATMQYTVDKSYSMLAIFVALAVIGLVLGAVHLSFHTQRWSTRIRKGTGVALMVAGITAGINWALTPERILPWEKNQAEAFAKAKKEKKGVMMDFYAKWCAPCKELELTFAAQGVYETIVDNYVPLKLDVTDATDADGELRARFKADTLPTIIFMDADGNELGRLRGRYMAPGEFKKKILDPATEKLKRGAAKISRSE